MFWSEAWGRDLVFILMPLSQYIPRERWLHCLNTRSCFPTQGLIDFSCRTSDSSTLFHWPRQANLFHHGEDGHRHILTQKHLRPATPKLAKSGVICFELGQLQFFKRLNFLSFKFSLAMSVLPLWGLESELFLVVNGHNQSTVNSREAINL